MKLINQVSKDFPKLVQMKHKIEKFLTSNALPAPVAQKEGKDVYKLIIPVITMPPKRAVNQDTFTVFVAFEDNTQTPIYIAAYRVEEQKGITVGRHHMVWKDSTVLPDASFPHAVFFDIVMNTFDAVGTDTVHTVRAKSAWISRMDNALDLALFVYKVDVNGSQHTFTRLNSAEEIDASAEQLWTSSNIGAKINTLISNVEIIV